MVEHAGQEKGSSDEILCAVGRVANLKRATAWKSSASATRVVETNEYLETIYPNIFACGDAAGPTSSPHRGAHGMVLRSQCAVRAPQEIRGRLFRGAVGHVHRPGGGACRFE